MFRVKTWWQSITPQILAWVYLSALLSANETVFDYLRFLYFFVWLISISAFGYLFNDWCDIPTDRRSGKHNSLSSLSIPVRMLFVFGALLLGSTAWVLMRPTVFAHTLYAAQLIALVLYSIPLVRLKERAWLGVLADAFYAHVNPVLITIALFGLGTSTGLAWKTSLLALILIVGFLKGIRNILLHQVNDRKGDEAAGVSTLALQKGPLYSIRLINKLLPFELTATVLWTLVVSYQIPPFIYALIFFSVLSYLKFSGWKLSYLPYRQRLFKFLYFMNDYFENWVPVFFLIILAVQVPSYSFLLAAHLLLFPGFLQKLWQDITTIVQNFKTEEDY